MLGSPHLEVRMRSLFVRSAMALAAWGMACSAPNDNVPGGTGGGSSGSGGGVSGNAGVGGVSGSGAGGGFGAVGNTGSGTGASSGKMGCGSNLTATIRDLKQEHPDVEVRCKNVSKLNNFHDTGMVAADLGADNTPTYVGPATGTSTTTGPTNFFSWYHDVPGTGPTDPLANQKVNYTIEFTRDMTTGLTVFDARALPTQGFYPIDGQLWGNPKQCISGQPTGAQYVHNYYFTTELHTVFQARRGDVFSFSGDDDVWVYINRRLVVDLGGIHETLTQDVMIDTLGLTEGMEYQLDFFHAERQAQNSNFKIQTNLFFTVCGVVE
jgi:fibro-slime domain-containing protein